METENATNTDEVPLWRSMGPQELEHEYSPSSAIGGNYRPFVEEYRKSSDKARGSCPRIEILTYGNKPANTVDVGLPGRANGCPVIIYIHGGYWQELSKIDSFFGADAFNEQGIAYAAVDYTLAPKASLSEIVGECRQALDAVFAEAPMLGIDSNRIYLAGSSAGGHLSAMCCSPSSVTNGQPGKRLAGLILLSGVFELEPLVGTSVNDAVGMTIEEAQKNSPLLLGTASFPDTVITWGEQETLEFKRQSRALGRKLESSTRTVQCFESPSRNHFNLVHDMYDPTTKLGRSILDLINDR